MAKFFKGAHLVEAFRWTADEEQTEDPHWIIDAIKSGSVTFANRGRETVKLRIHLASHSYDATPGDWIIRDADGQVMACSHEAFNRDFQKKDELAMCD